MRSHSFLISNNVFSKFYLKTISNQFGPALLKQIDSVQKKTNKRFSIHNAWGKKKFKIFSKTKFSAMREKFLTLFWKNSYLRQTKFRIIYKFFLYTIYYRNLYIFLKSKGFFRKLKFSLKRILKFQKNIRFKRSWKKFLKFKYFFYKTLKSKKRKQKLYRYILKNTSKLYLLNRLRFSLLRPLIKFFNFVRMNVDKKKFKICNKTFFLIKRNLTAVWNYEFSPWKILKSSHLLFQIEQLFKFKTLIDRKKSKLKKKLTTKFHFNRMQCTVNKLNKDETSLSQKLAILQKAHVLAKSELRVNKNRLLQLHYERHQEKCTLTKQKLYKNKFLQLQIEMKFYENKLAKLAKLLFKSEGN